MNFTEAIVLAVEKVKAWIQSGGVKWDHVSDKPFVKVGGDTLTWDGNTEGLVSVDGAPFYKVSDAVPTKADCANGIAVVYGPQTLPIDGETAQACFMDDGAASFDLAIVIPYDNYVGDGLVASEAGVYFLNDGDAHISSLTIPGYTGFAKEQIDPKVLPEALQFGKTTVQGDTLEWDGNTEGLVSAADMYYKISDAVPTKADCANGIEYDGAVVDGETVQGAFADDGLLLGDGILFIPSDNYTLEGVTIPEAGVYFIKAEENYIHYLTIPGYSGFTKTEIKPIKPEYLPGAVMLYPDAENYLYADSDTSDTSKRITKAQLQEMLYSGRVMYLAANGMFLPAAAVSFSDTYGMFSLFDGESYTVFYTAEYTT